MNELANPLELCGFEFIEFVAKDGCSQCGSRNGQGSEPEGDFVLFHFLSSRGLNSVFQRACHGLGFLQFP